ncbi:MAG: protein kinase domain-containing protein [Myxococcota bacterium]
MEAFSQCPKCNKALSDAPNFCPACGEDLRGLTPTSDTLSGPWSGRIIDNRYRLLEKLGEGGMGSVFKVEHVKMGKMLALKLLRPDLALDKKLKARFHQEARVVSKLSHPNTIQVFDFGELDDGSLYIAMEYLPGRDLAWTLRARGPVSEEQALSIGIQALASLSEAHETGIVHRDIKPANVILVKRKEGEDQVKVLDFGIAKFAESEGRKHITGVSEFIGTPAYMSPEQANGEELDARSDLYSLAAMLFELVTGRALFVGPTPMSVVTKHCHEPPPRFSEVAPDKLLSLAFENVLRRALAKKRDERFDSAESMRAALEKVRRELGALSHEFTPLPEEPTSKVAKRSDFDRFERRLRLRRTLLPLVTLGVLAAAGVGAFHLYQRLESGTRTAEKEPNDTPTAATHMALGAPVRGTIGPGTSDGRSDRDVYVLEAPEGPLRVSISSVEDLNLSVELSAVEPDEAGKPKLRRLLFLDDMGQGQPERVDAFSFAGGLLYVRVEEAPHFTEAPRSAREKSSVEYVLEVAAQEAVEGQLEKEPNDTLTQAGAYATHRAVTAFTGAPLRHPGNAAELDRPGAPYFSSVDVLFADVKDSETKVSALVVPPAGGALAVVDAGLYETWSLKVSNTQDPSSRTEALRPVRQVERKPELMELSSASRGYGVRVLPPSPTEAGARYQVAFLTNGPNGLAGAIDLARVLESEGRLEERHAALKLAADSFPSSPQVADVRALLRREVVKQTP